MTHALIALLLSCACRPRTATRIYWTPFERPAPRVGDRSEIDAVIDQWIRTEEGEHTEYRSSIRQNEILAMEGERITKMRVELRKQIRLVDRANQTSVLGDFVVEERDGDLEITRPDGAEISEDERAFVHRISAQTFIADTSRSSLFSRKFEVGRAARLSREEATSFGLGDRSAIDLTLIEVRPEAFVVRISGESKIGDIRRFEFGERWSGQIEISRSTIHTEEWTIRVVYFQQSGDVGQSNQRLAYQLIPNTVR